MTGVVDPLTAGSDHWGGRGHDRFCLPAKRRIRSPRGDQRS